MGGCRCIFRECTVATSRHPRMHFFQFPIKNRARLLKWIAMAKVPSLLNLRMSVQKIRCVCARHFRDECFVNYLKDKLVTSAVPTMERIKGGFGIDYEDDVVKVNILTDPVLPHMIPPPDFECPLHLEELDMKDFVGYTKPSISTSVSKRKLAKADSTIVSKNCEETEENTLKTFESEENTIETVQQEESTTKNRPYKVYEVSTTNDSNKAKRKNDIIHRYYEFQLQKQRNKYVSYEENSSKQEMQFVEAFQTASHDLEMKTLQYDTDTQELTSKIEQLTANNSDLESKCENLTISNSLLISRLKMFEVKHNSLQEQCNDLRANNLALQEMLQQQQVSTVSTSKEAPSNRATVSGIEAVKI